MSATPPDDARDHVDRFLRAIHEAQMDLRDTLGAELWDRGLPASATAYVQFLGRYRPALGHPTVGICLSAARSPRQIFEFWVEVWVQADAWVVRAEVYGDAQHGQERIHAFPERPASTLEECLDHLRAAVADLATCAYLVEEYRPGE